jgi:hypothetical protein
MLSDNKIRERESGLVPELTRAEAPRRRTIESWYKGRADDDDRIVHQRQLTRSRKAWTRRTYKQALADGVISGHGRTWQETSELPRGEP